MIKGILSVAAMALAMAGCSQTAAVGITVSGPGKAVMLQACDSGGMAQKGCGDNRLTRMINCDANNNQPKCFAVNEKN